MTVFRLQRTRPRMTDWEMWACANAMRKQHGDDASVQAAMRVDAMLAAADREGYRVWCEILARIATLGPATDEHATKH